MLTGAAVTTELPKLTELTTVGGGKNCGRALLGLGAALAGVGGMRIAVGALRTITLRWTVPPFGCGALAITVFTAGGCCVGWPAMVRPEANRAAPMATTNASLDKDFTVSKPQKPAIFAD